MKKKAIFMAVTPMAVTEKMRNIIYKYGLLFSIGMFLFFSFSSIALAVNYGEGLYGDGIYSATIPSATATGSSVLSRYNNLISMGNTQAAEELKKEFPDQFSNNQIPLTPSTQTTSIITPTPSTPIIINRILKLVTPRISGDDVKSLQIYLNSIGFDSGTPDGSFGPKTKAAVILFQKANGLTPDGIVGPKTVNYMNTGQSQNPIVTPPVTTFSRTLKLTSPRMTGNDVKDLQTYLNTHGYDVGTADGIFGNKTKSAVITFQTANNLTPDGIVGPKTAQLMK